MKRVLTAIVLAMFTAGMVGCEASAEIDDDVDRDRNGDTTYRKETKTTRTDDGMKTTKTETKIER